jgi:hypothetical protein
MTFALTLAAVRHHPVGVVLTALMAIVTASLLAVSAPLALVAWAVTGLVCLELWYILEPVVLSQFGDCRLPTAAEHQRIEAALGRTHVDVLIADVTEFTAMRGLRCLAIGRDMLDVLEDRALSGYLAQAAAPLQSANLAGFILVWLGNLPVLAAWWATRLVGQFGRLLALVVGTSLVVPLVVCREGFLRWAGLVFTTVLVGLCGSALLSYGFAAVGLGLMLAWLVVPSVHAVLDWESRRVERSADLATIDAGLGPQLLEAIDFLALVKPDRPATGLLSIVCLPSGSMVERARWIRRRLAIPEVPE